MLENLVPGKLYYLEKYNSNHKNITCYEYPMTKEEPWDASDICFFDEPIMYVRKIDTKESIFSGHVILRKDGRLYYVIENICFQEIFI